MFLRFYAWNGSEFCIALDAIQLIKRSKDSKDSEDSVYYIFLGWENHYKLYKSLNPEVFEALTKYLENNCLK